MTGQAWEPTRTEIVAFQNEVLDWFRSHGRDLPWRRTRNPYCILVSEIMLQQTQVSRVIPYYVAFLERFPDVGSLAEAPISDVLRAWSGLGYNRRALFLKKAAETIVRNHQAVVPNVISQLQQLPGVGVYTASAIGCFAFELQIPLIETNVRRAIRYFAMRCGSNDEVTSFEHMAGLLLPEGQAWEWNQAIMDFGAHHPGSRPQIPEAKPRTALAFRQTDRYRRGRILAMLCNSGSAIPVDRILREFPSQDEIYRVTKLLTSLQKEGLVDLDECGSLASLPQEGGAPDEVRLKQ